MRILFINGDVPWPVRSGCAKFTDGLLNLLAPSYETHLICLRGRSSLLGSAPATLASAHVLRRELYSKRIAQMRALASRQTMIESLFSFRSAVAAVRARIERLSPDAVIYNHIRAGWLSRYLSNATRDQTKSIYIAHNAEADTYRHIAGLYHSFPRRLALGFEAIKLRRLESQILTSIDTCVVLTPEDRNRLRSISPLTVFRVIPPAISVSSSPVDVSGNVLNLLLVGSFHWAPKRENVLWVINDVLPLLLARDPRIRLQVVGAGAQLLRPSAAVAHAVELHANVDSTDRFFKSKCIFVVPERQIGGIKLKTLEAAAHGLPIVSTSAGVEGTGLKDGISCLVADTVDDFASCLLSLINDQVRRYHLSHSALCVVSQDFGYSTISRLFTGLFNDLVGT